MKHLQFHDLHRSPCSAHVGFYARRLQIRVCNQLALQGPLIQQKGVFLE